VKRRKEEQTNKIGMVDRRRERGRVG